MRAGLNGSPVMKHITFLRLRLPATRPAAVVVALSCAVAAAAGASGWLNLDPEAGSVVPQTPAANRVGPTPAFAVDRAQLGHHVVRALDALGDRFETPGKARTILRGTLTRHAGSARGATPVAVVREFPDGLRVEELTGPGGRVLGHDGSRPWARGGGPSGEELALVEALARDSVEHFVAGQAAGDATLHLGDMFRLDDGSGPGYAGPFYDILRVDDTFAAADGIQSRPTLYYLNSRTGLPERIAYEREEGAAIKVEVEFGDWATVSGQKVPRRTVWKENGVVTAEFVVNQAAFAPAAQDGTFNAPAGR
jgi:hypothetical protein